MDKKFSDFLDFDFDYNDNIVPDKLYASIVQKIFTPLIKNFEKEINDGNWRDLEKLKDDILRRISSFKEYTDYLKLLNEVHDEEIHYTNSFSPTTQYAYSALDEAINEYVIDKIVDIFDKYWEDKE